MHHVHHWKGVQGWKKDTLDRAMLTVIFHQMTKNSILSQWMLSKTPCYLDEKEMVPLQGRVEEAVGPFANLLNTQETRVV